jgi:hypothetical protein
MTKLFGVDIAAILNQSLGPGLLKMTLVRLTPGQRVDGDLTSGVHPSRKTYACKGVVVDYRLSQFDGDLVQKGDRRVLLLGKSLPSGIVPQSSDHIQAEGVEAEVVNVIRDPASATYDCQVRGA